MMLLIGLCKIKRLLVELSLFGLHEQVKQKQKGAKRMLLPSVEGQEGGKWIVIDSGMLYFHPSHSINWFPGFY